MSVQLAKDFLTKVATDEALARKADTAQRAALLALSREAGYSFSDRDLLSAMEDVDELDELAAADLENIAGGARRRLFDS